MAKRRTDLKPKRCAWCGGEFRHISAHAPKCHERRHGATTFDAAGFARPCEVCGGQGTACVVNRILSEGR